MDFSNRVWYNPFLNRIPLSGAFTTKLPGVAQLVARQLWDFISAYPLCFFQSAETLGTLRKPRFSCSRKIPSKVVHTTCLLLQNKISYSFPGVAQLVARVVWDHQAAGSNPVTRTIFKKGRVAEENLCSTLSFCTWGMLSVKKKPIFGD